MTGSSVLLPLFVLATLAGAGGEPGEPPPPVTLTPQQKEAVSGNYRTKDGRTLWLGPFGEFGAELYFLDFQTGAFRGLQGRSPTSFTAGAALVPAPPVAITIEVQADAAGAATGLRYREGEGAAVEAKREVPVRRPVHFRSGDLPLAGTLTLPAGPGPFPALVLLHGSGPEDRHYLGPWVDFFAAQGLAVLAYDKRGVGASGGDWKTAGFDELARDAESALRILLAQPGIDPARIGVFGISQGGWLAPRLAAGLRKQLPLAFVIVHSGAAVTPAEQGRQHLEHELRAYGLPEDSIADAVAFQKRDDDYTRSGQGWEALQAAYRAAVEAKAPWLYADLRPADDPFRQMYRKMMDFDPLPFWRQVQCPVLALFGELDFQVPPKPNADLLRQALAGNPRAEVVVFPKANHLLLQAGKGTMEEYPTLKAFEPSYFQKLASWLASTLREPKPAARR